MKEKLLIFMGLCLDLYIIAINIMSGTKIAFSVPTFIFGLCMIMYGAKGRKIINYVNMNKKVNKLYRIMKILVIIIFIGLLGIEGIIISYPKHDTRECDYILVLGAGLKNGVDPSCILRYRLNAVIDLINESNDNEKIVVSGGQGNDEDISEAQAMKSYLVDNGVDEKRILMEDRSSTTSENFKFSRKVIEEDSNMSIKNVDVKIVTTDFHAFRSKLIARKNGYEKVSNYSSPTVWYLIPVNYIRESLAVVKSVLLD